MTSMRTQLFLAISPSVAIAASILPQSAISRDEVLREAGGVFRDKNLTLTVTDEDGPSSGIASAKIRIPSRGKGVARGTITTMNEEGSTRFGWDFRIKKVNCTSRKVTYTGKALIGPLSGTIRATAKKRGSKWKLDAPLKVSGTIEGVVNGLSGKFKGQ